MYLNDPTVNLRIARDRLRSRAAGAAHLPPPPTPVRPVRHLLPRVPVSWRRPGRAIGRDVATPCPA